MLVAGSFKKLLSAFRGKRAVSAAFDGARERAQSVSLCQSHRDDWSPPDRMLRPLGNNVRLLPLNTGCLELQIEPIAKKQNLEFSLLLSGAKEEHLEVFLLLTAPENEGNFQIRCPWERRSVKPFTESERGIHLPVCIKLKLQGYLDFPSKHSKLARMTFLSFDALTIDSLYLVKF